MAALIRTLLLGVAVAAAAPGVLGQPAQPPASWASCAACHAAQGAASIGPSLTGVVGRKAGALPGFGYSRAMKGANITWDENTLAAFIRDPQKTVPGNRMPFAGLSDPAEVAALVTYLRALR